MATVTAEVPPGYYEPDDIPDEQANPTQAYARIWKRTKHLWISAYPYQRPLLEEKLPAQFNFMAWGTKAGKTTSMVLRMARLLWETKERQYRWIAPFHGQSQIAERRLLRIFPKGHYEYRRGERRLIGPKGTSLTFHSGERPDTLPGEDVDGAVLDEASRLREEAYHATVSTILATKGWICAISTPHGRNWFYQQCKRGMRHEPNYYFTKFPSFFNPTIDPDLLRQTQRALPQFVYRELIWADFASEVEKTFPALTPCATHLLPRNRPTQGKAYVIGVDVGQIRDRNVATVWDVFDAALVSWLVAQGRDYTLIADDLWHLSKRWNNAKLYIERNGPGLPLIQLLARQGANLGRGPDGEFGFTTTGGNKPALVHDWSMALRNGEPMLPSEDKWPDLYDEHDNFEYAIAKSGAWTFEAATGHHDDIVMSCLIGWWGLRQNLVRPNYWRPGEALRRRITEVTGRDKRLIVPAGEEEETGLAA